MYQRQVESGGGRVLILFGALRSGAGAQGYPDELLGNVAHFCVCRSQEFAPGRQPIEEVPDLYSGAVVAAAGADVGLIAAIDFEAVGGR